MIDEASVETGEISVGDEVGDKDSGVVILDKSDSEEEVLINTKDILTAQ